MDTVRTTRSSAFGADAEWDATTVLSSAPVLAMVSGLLYGLSLTVASPSMRAPLGLVALAPLFTGLVGPSIRPSTAALVSALWTVAATAVVASWFPSTLEGYFGVSKLASAIGFVLLALGVNAPPYVVLGAWLSWRTRRGPVSPLVVGGAFMLAELARAAGVVPNPYAMLGLSQVGAPTAQAAEWIGGFGVTGLAATTAALVASVFRPELRGRVPRRDAPLALAVVFGFVVLGCLGAAQVEEGDAATASMRVAVIQPGYAPSHREEPDARRVDHQIALSRAAMADAPDLLVWPEHAVGFYPREATELRAAFVRQVRSLGTDLVFGAPHYRNDHPRPAYFASLFLVRDGELAGRTDKRALVPFAEYDPLDGLLPVETAGYAPGASFHPLVARGAHVGGFICGEVLFPHVARELSRAGATLLANPSNDGWFTAERAARHQMLSARLRAIENRRPVVRAATNGYSALIDARGDVVAVSGRGVAEVVVADVHPSRIVTAYQQHPHALGYAAALAVVGSTWRAARRGDRPGARRIPTHRDTEKGRSS